MKHDDLALCAALRATNDKLRRQAADRIQSLETALRESNGELAIYSKVRGVLTDSDRERLAERITRNTTLLKEPTNEA